MLRKIAHQTDQLLTQKQARQRLETDPLLVIWFTNKENRQSVVHSHPYYECILPVEGEVLYSVNGDLYHLNSGELIIFPEEVFHSGKYDVGPVTSERLVLQIDQDLWHDTAQRLGLADRTWNRELSIVNRTNVTAWNLRGLLERMSLTAALPASKKNAAHRAQLVEFLLLLDHITQENETEAPTATSLLAAKTVEYIRTHYAEPELSVAQLAELNFVSRGHLSRVFKEYTMESIHGYITNLRMQHCRDAIAAGKSVLDACNESGFSDYSSFLKTFRKLYGISPSEYRTTLKRRGE